MEVDRLLSRTFVEAHAPDAAAILERIDAGEAAAFLLEVSPRDTAAVLQRMTPTAGADCLAQLPAGQAAAVLAEVPLDGATLLLRRMDAPARAAVLASLPGLMAERLTLLLRYPEGTAGALMDPRALALPHEIPVGEALARVRHAARDVLYYLYVVDRAQTLVGVLNLRELMLAARKTSVASVMRPHVARLSARADRTTILAHPGWREFHALPVVDEAGLFLGVIRYETVRRLEEDRAPNGQGGDALATVLTLGELCWHGMALVLADLAAGVGPTRPPDRVEEGSHGG